MRRLQGGSQGQTQLCLGSHPTHPHSHGFGEALWVWPLQRYQLQALHPRWDRQAEFGIFSWRPSLRLPGGFIPGWSNPTFPSLAPRSGSDFATFASSACEFSDEFWGGFFPPLDLRGAQEGQGGG